MAGKDETPKQFQTLTPDFNSENLQRERRIAELRNRLEEVNSELEAASLELEEARRVKRTAKQEIKGYEVELSINEASLREIEAERDATKKEISKVGAELEAMKSEENLVRDAFIEKMLELNVQIRKFQESLSSFKTDIGCPEIVDVETYNTGSSSKDENDAQNSTMELLETKLKEITLQIDHDEQQPDSEQLIHDELQQELTSLEKKALLLDSIMKESMELQDLKRQTSELDERYLDLDDELQERFLCPNCGNDNSEELAKSPDSQMTGSQME